MSAWKMPDNTETKEYYVYHLAWKKLTKPLCERLGWTCLAFTPECLFEIEKGVTLSLPVSVVRKLRDIITERDELVFVVQECNDIIAERDELSRALEALNGESK